MHWNKWNGKSETLLLPTVWSIQKYEETISMYKKAVQVGLTKIIEAETAPLPVKG